MNDTQKHSLCRRTECLIEDKLENTYSEHMSFNTFEKVTSNEHRLSIQSNTILIIYIK